MSSVVVIWVWLCAYLNCAGWALSACQALNKAGYAVVLAIGLGILLLWSRKTSSPIIPRIHLPKFRWRFRHAFPLAFLTLAVLAFIGGALYAPANYDSLAYRTPRVLHWLAAGHWEWIHTEFHRLNTRTAGFEWVTAPLFLFSGSDRLEFLLNMMSFLLLPGRVFSMLVLLGARPRTAWHWMWLFPAGFGYILQAGSSVNDLFATLFAITAIEFALRARREQKTFPLWTSGLAAALMTSAKAFNLLLLLPWFIAAFPALKTLLRRPLASAVVIVFALGASMIPTSILNAHYCRDWTGATLEQTPNGGGHELTRFIGNFGSIAVSNFQPPVFPFVKQWDDFIARVVPLELQKNLRANMEGGLARFMVSEVAVEESSGLGCGLSLLLVIVIWKKFSARRREKASAPAPPPARPVVINLRRLVILGSWFALLVLITRAGYVGPARYLLPFYVLLFIPALTGDTPSALTRRHWWQPAGLLVFFLAMLVLVLSPQRPLWPAQSILPWCGGHDEQNTLRHRALSVYAIYGRRANSFGPVLEKLPPGVTTLGFMGLDEPEGALWKPYGARRIENILVTDTPEYFHARGIQYALVNADFMRLNRNVDFDAWLRQNRGREVEAFQLKIRVGKPAGDWRLVAFSEN